VHSELAQERRNQLESCIGINKAPDQLPVHGEIEGLIQLGPDFLPQVGAPEHGFLGNEISISQYEFPVSRHDPFTDIITFLVYQDPVSINDINVRRVHELRGHSV